MAELKVSAPGDIRRNTSVVALPVEQGGVQIVLRLRAVPTAEVITCLDGIPGMNSAPGADDGRSWAEKRASVLQAIEPTKRLAAAGIVEPEFAFGEPEEGKANWDDLVQENQAFVVRTIMELSGFSQPAGGS